MKFPHWLRSAARVFVLLLCTAALLWTALVISAIALSGVKGDLLAFVFPHVAALILLAPLLAALKKKTRSWFPAAFVVSLLILHLPFRELASWMMVNPNARPMMETNTLFEPGHSVLFQKTTPKARGYDAAQREEQIRLWLDGALFKSLGFEGEDGAIHLIRFGGKRERLAATRAPLFRYTVRCRLEETRLARILPMYRTLSVEVRDNQNGERIAWAKGYGCASWWGDSVNRLFSLPPVFHVHDESVDGWGIPHPNTFMDMMTKASRFGLDEAPAAAASGDHAL